MPPKKKKKKNGAGRGGGGNVDHTEITISGSTLADHEQVTNSELINLNCWLNENCVYDRSLALVRNFLLRSCGGQNIWHGPEMQVAWVSQPWDHFFPSVFWRFRKTIPARFPPGAFATLNPGVGGGGVGRLLARLGNWPRPWPICWWFAGGQLLKAGGSCFVLTLPASRTLSFHCISLYFTHLLNRVWGFCVDMAPC